MPQPRTRPTARPVLGAALLVAVCLLADAGLAQPVPAQPGALIAPGRPVIAADASRGLIAWVHPDGTLRWSHEIRQLHDLHLLPNGHVLFQETWTRLVEADPETGEVVWSCDAATSHGNAGRRVEVHAFQRLANGNTVLFESGPARVIEVTPDGELARSVPLTVEHPNAHSDTRLARVLDNGHCLVAHEADGVVREYDRDGVVVWSFAVPLFGRERAGGHGHDAWGNQCFAAVRLGNGHTLISTGNGHSVLEVNPAGEVVWSITQDELPGVSLAWVTTLQPMPNGNLVIGNCHAGPDQPQLIEVTRDKAVVWSYNDFHRFGNALSNALIVE